MAEASVPLVQGQTYYVGVHHLTTSTGGIFEEDVYATFFGHEQRDGREHGIFYCNRHDTVFRFVTNGFAEVSSHLSPSRGHWTGVLATLEQVTDELIIDLVCASLKQYSEQAKRFAEPQESFRQQALF